MHPRQRDKPPVTEIYELYCWQTPQAVWQFVLWPNTSREKTVAEVFHNPEVMSGVEAFDVVSIRSSRARRSWS